MAKSVSVPEMPGPEGRSSPSDDVRDAELKAVLDAARKALRRGDGWRIDHCHYDRLRRDCESIGLSPNEPALTINLRDAFSEITQIRRREDQSYAGLETGQTLYEARWESSRFKRIMYLKFAMDGDVLEILTFHQHTEGRR